MWNSTLVIEPETLRVNEAGSATGNIWLDLNGKAFPADDWNDFIVVVTGWWVAALLRLVSGERTRENVPFMDGPYSVEVTLDPSGILRFKALRDIGDRKNEIASGDEPAEDFILALISQSRALLHACRVQGFSSKDVEALQIRVDALKRRA